MFDWIRNHIYHILLNWIYFRHTAHFSTFFQSYPYLEDILDTQRIFQLFFNHIPIWRIFQIHSSFFNFFSIISLFWGYFRYTPLMFDWIRNHIYHILLNWIYFRHTAHCSTFFQSYPFFEDISDTHLWCFFVFS